MEHTVSSTLWIIFNSNPKFYTPWYLLPHVWNMQPFRQKNKIHFYKKTLDSPRVHVFILKIQENEFVTRNNDPTTVYPHTTQIPTLCRRTFQKSISFVRAQISNQAKI